MTENISSTSVNGTSLWLIWVSRLWTTRTLFLTSRRFPSTRSKRWRSRSLPSRVISRKRKWVFTEILFLISSSLHEWFFEALVCRGLFGIRDKRHLWVLFTIVCCFIKSLLSTSWVDWYHLYLKLKALFMIISDRCWYHVAYHKEIHYIKM